MNRIHNTVKGWGGQGANANNARHAYTCSKCHTVHNSRLPRLMVTNCLDYSHRGKVTYGAIAGSGSASHSESGYQGQTEGGSGSGHFPAGGSGTGTGGSGFHWFGNVACHDATNSDGWPNNQRWNTVTPWTNGPPSVPVAIQADTTSTSITLQWVPSTDTEGNTPIQYYVQVDNDPNFGSNDFGGAWQTNTQLPITVAQNTVWYWKIKAKDSTGFETVWSSTDRFIVSDGIVPPAPTLSNPTNGSSGVTACDTVDTWVAFSYYSKPAAEYHLLVDDNPAFGSPNYDSGWTISTTSGASISSNWSTATYYWKVGARDP